MLNIVLILMVVFGILGYVITLFWFFPDEPSVLQGTVLALLWMVAYSHVCHFILDVLELI